jgi:hypothetical protein
VLAQETEGAVGHRTTRQRARCGDGDSARGRSATQRGCPPPASGATPTRNHGCGGGAEIEAAGRGLCLVSDWRRGVGVSCAAACDAMMVCLRGGGGEGELGSG